MALALATGCAHAGSTAPTYRCEAFQVRSGDELVGTMVITSTVHGDFGTLGSCEEKFSVGYGEYILSPEFAGLRAALARQSRGEELQVVVTGRIEFELRSNKVYPGSARFISIESWALQ